MVRLLVRLGAALAAGFVALLPFAAAAAPDARLRAAAEQAQPAVIETLRQIVAIESGSLDTAGLARLADLIERRLASLGMQTERHRATGGAGADIVVGTLRGDGGRNVMLLAHSDTVYSRGILSQEPMRQEGNKLFGPGIADDKGGVAVILHALELLRAQGWRAFGTVTVVITPDEEVGSIGSGELISRLADQHDFVLSYEPSPAKEVAKAEALLLAAAGGSRAYLEVKGRAAHAGAAPELGRNALIELAHQLLQTREVAAGIPGAQLNWTTSTAGTVRNQIPDKAAAVGDVRLTRPGAEARLLAALQDKVASSRLVPDTETTVRFETIRPPFVAGEAGMALARHAQAIYAELDNRPLILIPGSGGGTDAGFAGRSGKAAVLESFGLAGFGYHARDEYIEIDSIVPRLYLSARMLIELGRR